MPNRHLHPLTAEIVAAIAETQRHIAEAHNELDGLVATARERIAQSRELLEQTDKILTQR